MSEIVENSSINTQQIEASQTADQHPNQATTDSSQNPGMNRRKFLGLIVKTGATTAAAATLGSSTPPSSETAGSSQSASQETAETMKPNEKRLVIDFFDLSSIDQLIEQNLSPEQGSLEKVLKNMGVENPSDVQNLKNAHPKNEAEEKIILLLALKNRYQKHGDTVVDVGHKVSDDLGIRYQEPEKKDASSALQSKGFTHDEKGNHVLHLFISDQTIEQIVERSEARDVGLSLETGDFTITYNLYDKQLKDPLAMLKPKPSASTRTITNNGIETQTTIYYDAQNNIISKEDYDKAMAEISATELVMLEPKDRDFIIEDGYAGKKTYENLLRMVNLAKKFPGKNFFTAGGNPRSTAASRPDIREARKRIIAEIGKMPDNLSIVGVKGRTQDVDYAASLGCDIYVDEEYIKTLGLPPASSYATPVIGEIASTLAAKGLNGEKVRTVLNLMSNSIRADGETIDVLSIDKAKALLPFIE